MEAWLPLFDIFLNSPTPETEASLWLQQSFNASSSTPITTGSFVALLTKPIDAIVGNSSPPSTKRIMFIQTLPDMVQSRILSFLSLEHDRFCKWDLSKLARGMFTDNFLVKRAARNLLDKVSASDYRWVSGFSLDSGDEIVDEEFFSMPDWLKDVANTNELLLPWLPMSHDDLNSKEIFGSYESEQDLLSEVPEIGGDGVEEFEKMEIDHFINAPIEEEIKSMAVSLGAQILNFESSSKTAELAKCIRQLCLERGRDSFAVLGLIEPWRADDETASILMANLLDGSEEELGWSSQVLCSVILPKMLVLEEPASRVLVTTTIEYCKLHQRAAEYALLFPLILRNAGVNNPICDIITKIVKECFHPAHISAFCQKLLCGEEYEKRFICLHCHHCLISNELVWTESLFSLFHNILNLNAQLTQDSAAQLVLRICELAPRFSRSLKFGNFLLCFITKCTLLLKSHKQLLVEAVEQTDTLVTKSMLSKLACF